jgi:very-short-patch-repair endonuclease
MSTIKAKELRRNPTEAERKLWRYLRLRQVGGYKFRRQQPLGPYIVDFVSLEKRLIVEVDGGQHSEQVDYDAERSAWLEAQGFRVLRFWDNEVLRSIDVVKEVIAEVLNSGFNPPP